MKICLEVSEDFLKQLEQQITLKGMCGDLAPEYNPLDALGRGEYDAPDF